MPKKEDSRKRYWNEEYYHYWKSRVKEANENTSNKSNLIKGDSPTPSDKSYFSAIDLLTITRDSTILEVGCGFGRSIPFLYSKTKKIYAIDISEQMIEAARKRCSECKEVNFLVSEAEKTPFNSDFFDHIICYGVFDATYQNKVLLEMNRILKKNGRILITGKNDNYFADDQQALIAEINARGKRHPNYFTDLKKLFENLDKFGFSLTQSRFFLRRDDFRKEQFLTIMPDRFYEYLIILSKNRHTESLDKVKISSKFSKTFQRLQKKSLLEQDERNEKL